MPRTLRTIVALAWAVATAAGAGAQASRRDPDWTGALSEEAFKALHALKPEAAPPARGTWVEIAGGRAYLSLPDAPKPPLPGVVVIHEWWGLNDHIRHWTDRLAAAGYAALAVDLYAGKVATTSDSAMAYVRGVDEERALAVLRAAHAFLAADARIRAPKRAAIGWCFGGGWSLRLALAEPELDACVLYYGRLVHDVERLQAIAAAVLGIFADRDRSIPPDAVDTFAKALAEAGVRHTILRYDAEHAFANPSSARYHQEAATEAWTHVQAFLAEHLQGAASR